MARVRSGRLALAIFTVALVAVGLTVGLPLLFAAAGLGAPPVDTAGATLGRAHVTLTAVERQRLDHLALTARLLAREGALIRVLGRSPDAAAQGATPDGAAALADLLAQRRPELGFDFALVLDPEGRVLAVGEGTPIALGADLAADPIVAGGLADGGAAGVWRGGGGLAQVAVEPVAPDFDLLGYLLVGARVDEVLSLEIGRASGAGVTFLAVADGGTEAVASSLGPQEAAELTSSLGARDGAVARALTAAEPREATAEVAAGRRRVMLVPLASGAGPTEGLALLSTPAAPVGGPLSSLLPLAAGAGLGLVLALLLAPLVARRGLAPAARLVEVVDAAPRESFARRLDPRRYRAMAPLAESLDRMFRGLHEERSLAAATLAALRLRSPDGAAEAAAEDEPVIGEGAVVVFEMRRHADLGAGVRQAADRLATDLGVLRRAVDGAGGHLVASAGHRVFAAFEGETAAWQALTAAAVGLDDLAAGEADRSDGDPAAAAVATGRLMRSAGATGTGSPAQAGLVTGPAVLLAESVLRETSPGELVMTRAVHRVVGERLAEHAVVAAEHRGLLSPQPLFVLALAAVTALAGTVRPSASSSAASSSSSSAPPAGGPVSGSLFAGRHRVLGRVGASAGAEAWRVRRTDAGGGAILKWMPGPAAGVLDQLRGLDGPLEAFRRFEHPGFAAVEEVGDAAGGVYIVREWVDGVPLTGLGEIPVPAALALGRQLATALAALHREGLVHGRLKPENVIVEADGRARLVDQAVAIVVGPAPSASAGDRLLGRRSEGGTPDVAEDGADRRIDPRADVYALAALIHRLTLGRWPGEETGEEAAEPPAGLTDLLSRALAEEPAARPGDAGELAASLEGITA